MLQLSNLAKSYGHRTLFQGVTYNVPEGARIAIVGPNGAGKTTLLDIICGENEADDGQVIVGQNTVIGYLPQQANPNPMSTVLTETVAGHDEAKRLRQVMDDAMQAMADHHDDASAKRYEEAEAAYRQIEGYAMEAKAGAILSGLGFSQSQLSMDPRQLSGGWRMRVELARLLLKSPDVLVLDEPTNHLDLPSLVWIESYLRQFKGTLIFVSHDRALLNRLSTITLHLHGGALKAYTGNFDAFLDQRFEHAQQLESQRVALAKRRGEMERFVERFGAKATKAKQAQSRVKMIEKLRALESGLEPEAGENTASINLAEPGRLPEIVASVADGGIGYDHVLTDGIQLSISAGQRIGVVGANGLGKSTLLKTIAGVIDPKGGQFFVHDKVGLGYFSQDQTDALDLNKTVLQNLLAETDLGEREARDLLGTLLFRGDDVFKEVRVLSGGERSRLGLACIIGRQCGVLLLDEPTNHLDMATAEGLAAALCDFGGSVIFVSHDRSFINQVANRILVLAPGGKNAYFHGDLDDYRRQASQSGFPDIFEESPQAKPTQLDERGNDTAASDAPKEDGPSHQEVKEMQRERDRLQKRAAQLEAEGEKLRSQLADIEKSMAEDTQNFARLGELETERQQLNEQIDATENDWLEASERAEELNETLQKLGRQ